VASAHRMADRECEDQEAGLPSQAERRLLDRLFRTERPRLLRYVRRRVGGYEDAHDLVQDAFERLATANPSMLSGAPEAYLRRIVHNILYDWFRSKHVKRAALHVPADEAPEVSVAPEQDWGLRAEETTKRYIAALDLLPPRTREIFLLNRVDGLSYKEVAVRMGLSVKAIEYHMTKALAGLHRTLYDE